MNIGEPPVNAVVEESQLLVVDAKLVQDGRVNVVQMRLVFHCFEAEFVGGAVTGSRGVKKLERAICYGILSSCRRVSKVISAAGSLLRYPPARTGFQRLGRLRN